MSWDAALFPQLFIIFIFPNCPTGLWKETRVFTSYQCFHSGTLVPSQPLVFGRGPDGGVIMATAFILEGAKHYEFNKPKPQTSSAA